MPWPANNRRAGSQPAIRARHAGTPAPSRPVRAAPELAASQKRVSVAVDRVRTRRPGAAASLESNLRRRNARWKGLHAYALRTTAVAVRQLGGRIESTNVRLQLQTTRRS